LTPFEIEYIVCDVVHLLSSILCVVKLLVNSAWLINELSA
jgi:hypothetical protein